MPGDDKYSVLLMRDDSHVRRFRVSPFVLKLALYSVLLLVLATGVSVYAAYTFWSENSVLLDERVGLEKQLLESQVHLERLQNVEKILESNNPEELQSMFGLAVQNEPAESPGDETVISDERQEHVEPPEEAAGTESVPEAPAPQVAATNATPPQPSMNLREVLGSIDTGLATVDNLKMTTTDNSVMRLTFDLVNTDSGQALNGRVKVFFISNDGRMLPVKADASDLSFQIQRFKNMSATFSLPDGLSLDDVFGLKLFINTPEGSTVLSKVYDLHGLLS